MLGTTSVPSTAAGHARLTAWAHELGVVDHVGIEGTGSYGAGLTRHLLDQGISVVEVVRPNRQTRRRRGKTDAIDAETAARSVLAGTALGTPKTADGAVEMIRTLRLVRRSAMKARTQAAKQLRAVLVTAPQALRDRLRAMSLPQLVDAAARCRPGQITAIETASKLALKSLATRYQQVTSEINAFDAEIEQLARQAAPHLMAIKGVGVDTAGALLAAAGDNPERLRSESAFAHLCGVAPIPASSGKTNRHRLNRGGNRDANRALYVLALGRLSYDERTRAYAARRTTEGKTKREIIRCIKRYLAREIFTALIADGQTLVRSTGASNLAHEHRPDPVPGTDIAGNRACGRAHEQGIRAVRADLPAGDRFLERLADTTTAVRAVPA
ncbi:IS110 family transposase [Micromonospora sp. CPCC 205711]|uniref:IS110 family transposase n=1 Tax=Micromonospora sp. CPCC 205547 TaxID=3122400 RepID=UPI002FF27449